MRKPSFGSLLKAHRRRELLTHLQFQALGSTRPHAGKQPQIIRVDANPEQGLDIFPDIDDSPIKDKQHSAQDFHHFARGNPGYP